MIAGTESPTINGRGTRKIQSSFNRFICVVHVSQTSCSIRARHWIHYWLNSYWLYISYLPSSYFYLINIVDYFYWVYFINESKFSSNSITLFFYILKWRWLFLKASCSQNVISTFLSYIYIYCHNIQVTIMTGVMYRTECTFETSHL